MCKFCRMFLLDFLYLFGTSILVAYIILEGHQLIDVVYLGMLTVYYIRIKVYRWQKYH